MTTLGTPRTRAPGRRRGTVALSWWRSDTGSVSADITIAAPLLVMLLVFVGVLIHRGVDARIRIDAAAHQAARAASLERTPTTAAAAAEATATTALSSPDIACDALSVHTDTSGLRPGTTVTVTISCGVDLGDALILGVPDKTLTATASEPIDRWRSTPTTGGAA